MALLVRVYLDKEFKLQQDVNENDIWNHRVEKMLKSSIIISPENKVISTVDGKTYSFYSSTNINEKLIPVYPICIRRDMVERRLTFKTMWSPGKIVNIHLVSE